MNQNSVEDIVDIVQRVACRHQERCRNDRVFPALLLLHHSEELYSAAECICTVQIRRRYLRDALAVDILKCRRSAADNGGDDCDLARRVVSLNVSGGVSLRISVFLRPLQRFIKPRSLLLHFRKDVVRGSIEDAGDGGYVFLRKSCDNRAEQRDASSDTRLKKIAAVMCLCSFHELRALRRDELLIGSTDTDTLFKECLREFICCALASHRLADNGNGRIIQDRIDIVHDPAAVRTFRKLPEVENVLYMNAFPD